MTRSSLSYIRQRRESFSICAQVALLAIVITLPLIAARPAASAAQTQESKATKRYDIGGGPLGAVLSKFAGVAGVVLSFDATQTEGMNSSGLQGEYSVESGFTQLLAGAGLEAVPGVNGVYTLRKVTPATQAKQVSAQEPQQEPAITLPPVTVQEQKESADGPVKGHVATRSATGTKTDTPLIEIPRSVSVVTGDQIEMQKVNEIGAALRYTPGIFTEHRGIDATRQSVVIRGFLVKDIPVTYRDGLLGKTSNFNHADPDVYGLERVEILRGPASVLYGQGSPGGLINSITKKPTENSFGEVEGNFGNFSLYSGKFDLGGSIDQDKTLRFRFTGLRRENDAQVEFLDEKRLFLAPAFSWHPSANTTFTFLSNYQKDNTHEAAFLPASGTVLSNPNGNLPRDFLPGEPKFDGFDKETFSVGYIFDHSFNDTWKVRQILRYNHGILDFKGIGATGFQLDNRTLNRVGFTIKDKVDSVATDSNIQTEAFFGPTKHRLLLGVDYKWASVSETFTCCFAVPPIDAFAPVYGQAITIGPPTAGSDQDAFQIGLYVQDQFKFFDRLVVSLGGRYDWANNNSIDQITRVKTKQTDTAFTGQTGLTYLFNSGVAPYASYATSFEPQPGRSFSGTLFNPTKGKQFEIGVKYQPAGYNSFITLSGYHLIRKNVLTTDPVNIGFSVQTGEVRSRGVEVEAKANLLDRFNVTIGYSFTDSKVTKSNGDDLGKRPSRVPEHLASLWTDYSVAAGAFGKLTFGGGVRYVGSAFGDGSNTLKVPGFTVFDAVTRYDIDHGRLKGAGLAVNVANLFDKSYIAGCDGPNGCAFGMGRVIIGSIKYRW